MKVILLSVAMMATALLVSCGDKEGDKKGADVCECMKQKHSEMSDECKDLAKEWEEKVKSAESDEERDKVYEEMEQLTKDCEK